MTKARTLADFISDGSPLADGTIDVSEVSGSAPLANPAFTGTASGTFSGPLTGELDLAAIAETKSVTAVDVFVYDTSKDSDGGAWRKRTQGTSWYNEALNTSTRGSRKEFPAVAVIVADSNQVTIYDGDDPDLPMWMVFGTTSNTILRGAAADVSSVIMGQGQLLVGANDSSGFYKIDFLKDSGIRFANAHTANTGLFHLTIAQRSNTAPISIAQSPGLIANSSANDVAMTVLPNAPIDAATGLPVPTIAVATDGGVSVIKDDGTVVDGSVTSISFDNIGFIGQTLYVARKNHMNLYVYSSFASDGFVHDYVANTNYTAGDAVAIMQQSGTDIEATASSKDTIYLGADNGEGLKVALKGADNTLDNVSFITSDYNTGWMNGDIKLATLSDTDATDVVGAELVTNGTFDSDVSGWTANGSAVLSVVSNTLKVENNGSYGGAYQSLTTVVGQVYTLSFDLVEISGGNNLNTFNLPDGTFVPTSGAGSYSATFTATSTSSTITASVGGNAVGHYKRIDNVSVRLAEADRSVNGNGLQVFGTVTKTPVATGADLVGYDGWSGTNYLQQPYNSDLDFGTGDFSYMFWFANGTDFGDNNLIHRAGGSSPVGGVLFQSTSGFILNIWNKADGVGFSGANQQVSYRSGVWNHVVYTRRGSVAYVYLNGELKASMSDGTNMDLPDAKLRIGIRHDSTTNYFRGDLALLRISATAPSPEQIAKIYEDEKVLFQENAQATLYGSSDAVTALAHDDTTDLLHVGTSAGRSVFQGLRRVENTTDAVGTAISASNGLVVEE